MPYIKKEDRELIDGSGTDGQYYYSGLDDFFNK